MAQRGSDGAGNPISWGWHPQGRPQVAMQGAKGAKVSDLVDYVAFAGQVTLS